MAIRWRKSARSGSTGQCVELGRLDRPEFTGAVRDSKNPTGPTLNVELEALLVSIKSGMFDV
jgi:Domain of unknown function (DUF397)